MNPAKVQSTIKKAIALHQMDRLPKAEKLYKQVLKADPYCVDALHFYGLLHFNRGQIVKATELILAAIGLDPGYVDAYLNLGNIYLKTARLADAQKCYEKALEINPNHPGVLTNFGILLKCRLMFEASIKHLTAVTVSAPTSAEAYYNLANTYKAAGQPEQALENFKKAAQCNPQFEEAYHGIIASSRILGQSETAIEAIKSLGTLNMKSPTVSHMLAAWSGEDTPLRASDEYIRTTFDKYADSFESSLARLGYRGPALLGETLEGLFPETPNDLNLLDAGCGTGLAQPVLKPFAAKLVGMDLSQKMLGQARQKGGYDQLICDSLESGVARYHDYFDLIASIDTLIYFGELGSFLKVALGALKPGGYLVFTLERSDQKNGYELCQSGRYAHTRAYVAGQLASLAYTVMTLRSCVVRTELGQDVQGLLVVAQKTGSPGN